MAVLYTNNASTTLSASITSAATSLSVASGKGALFPAITGSDYFYLTLVSSSGVIEIMKVTARSADTLTVVRGQDGTSAVAWAAGDRVELRITKAMLDDFKAERMPVYGPSVGSGGSVMINLSGNPSWSDVNFTYDPITGSFRAIGLRASMGASAPTWNFNDILHAGNYSSYAAPASHTHSYLPLSGGALTGLTSVTGGSFDSTYTTTQTRFADGGVQAMKTVDGGIFEAIRAVNLSTTAGTTVRLVAAATSDAFNNANGGKVFIDAVRTATNMDLVFSLNATGGAAPTERVRFFGGGGIQLDGAYTVLHSGNYSSYSPSLTGSGASGTWGINVTGSSSVSSNLSNGGYGSGTLTWYQSSTAFQSWNSSWASFLISNHGDGSSYYNQTLIMPFWGPPQYMRKEGGNNVGPWVILSTENYTNYAAPASHTHSYLPLSGGTLTGKVYAGSSDGDSIEVRNDTASAASSGYITFKNKNSSGVYRPAARISGVNVDNAYDGDFLVETYSGGVAYKGLRVDENSNVLFYDTSGNVKFQWDAVNSRALINNNVVLHAGNYTSYSPSLTGSGASGSWGISITGNAATAYGLTYEQLFNNAGSNHSTRTDFNNVPGFGVHYVQGNGSGPSTCNQYYGFTLGLGNDYSYSQYAMQFAIPRMPTGGDNGNLYLSVRFREGGSWGSWSKAAAGYADTAGSVSGGLTTSNYSNYALPLSGGVVSGQGYFRKAQTDGNYTTAALWTESYNTTTTGIAFHISGVVGKYLEMRTNGTLYWNSDAVLHAGNYTNYTPVKVAGTAGYAHAGTGMYPFYNWGGANGGASAPSDGSYTIGISVGSHPSDQAYGFQIARNMWNTGLWTRGYDSGWGGWVRLLDSSNYTSYGDGRYVQKTGDTMSGVLTSAIGGAYGRFNGNDQYHALIMRGSVSGTTSQTVTAGDTMEFIEYGGVWNFRQVNDSVNRIAFTVKTTAHSVLNRPYTSGYQSVLQVGSDAGGLYFTTDNAIISKGAYYNSGWIATSTEGCLIDFTANGSRPGIAYFSGATAGSAVTFSATYPILHSANYSSYALPLSGGTLSGSLVNNQDGGVILESNSSENNNWLFKEAVKQWGIFYFNKGGQSGQTIGGYTTIGAETFYMGGSSGVDMPSGWTGYQSGSKIAAMISHYTGYIYSASTVYAASSMSVGGNTVLHAGNYTSYALGANSKAVDSDKLDGYDSYAFGPGGSISCSGDFQYGSISLSSNSFALSSANADADNHGRFWMYGTAGQIITRYLPIDKSGLYRMKIRWKTNIASATYLAVFLLDTSGNNISAAGTYWAYPWSGGNSPTSWQTNEYWYDGSSFPSNAAYVAFGISHTNYTGGAATYQVSQLEIERVNKQISGNTILHAGNYTNYVAGLGGGNYTGTIQVTQSGTLDAFKSTNTSTTLTDETSLRFQKTMTPTGAVTTNYVGGIRWEAKNSNGNAYDMVRVYGTNVTSSSLDSGNYALGELHLVTYKYIGGYAETSKLRISSGSMYFHSGGTQKLQWTSGAMYGSDGAYDIGASSYRMGNVYTYNLVFADGTTQTTAAGAPASVSAIGSVVWAWANTGTQLFAGGTISGSLLYAANSAASVSGSFLNFTTAVSIGANGSFCVNKNNSYNQPTSRYSSGNTGYQGPPASQDGALVLSGTWRLVSPYLVPRSSYYDGYSNMTVSNMNCAMFVRIS